MNRVLMLCMIVTPLMAMENNNSTTIEISSLTQTSLYPMLLTAASNNYEEPFNSYLDDAVHTSCIQQLSYEDSLEVSRAILNKNIYGTYKRVLLGATSVTLLSFAGIVIAIVDECSSLTPLCNTLTYSAIGTGIATVCGYASFQWVRQKSKDVQKKLLNKYNAVRARRN